VIRAELVNPPEDVRAAVPISAVAVDLTLGRSRPMNASLTVPVTNGELTGTLDVPETPHGIVIVAHHRAGTEQGGYVPATTDALCSVGLAVLRLDLYTDAHERELLLHQGRASVPLLAARITAAVEQVRALPETYKRPVGLFGAGTDAAPVLQAGASDPRVRAMVLWNGELELAAEAAPLVDVPALLIVTAADERLLRGNRHVAQRTFEPSRLETIDGHAGPDEALRTVIKLTRDWFAEKLR
jgi:putative phosphoribosyl transferase